MIQADSVFSGISTFGRLPYFPCLASDEEKYDIAFIGAHANAKGAFHTIPVHVTDHQAPHRRTLRHRHVL